MEILQSLYIPLGIFNFGVQELVIIMLILLLFFGAKKLPELARGMGKSLKEFRKATSEVEEDFRAAMDASDPKKQPPAPHPPVDKEKSKTDSTKS